MNVEKVEQPKLAQHDSSVLDLAFCMDCTGSMGSYIINARNSIRQIVEEIVASEKSDVRLGLVEYRDHPPQDRTFVTRPHDFTGSVKEMKIWLDQCSANGGGDGPEAVADGLHDVLKLSWREKSTKICVLISDAPPHGLEPMGDTMPNGCACGIDPIEVVQKMGEKGITLYCVGCEPAINNYKEFFSAIAYKTGGQYVPLRNANLLSKVIIGGAQEEISLEKLMEDVQAEVQAQVNLAGGVVDRNLLNDRVHQKLVTKGALTKNLKLNNSNMGGPSSFAMNFAQQPTLQVVQQQFLSMKPQMVQQQQQKSFSFLTPQPPAPSAVPLFSFGSAVPPSGTSAIPQMQQQPPMMFQMPPPKQANPSSTRPLTSGGLNNSSKPMMFQMQQQQPQQQLPTQMMFQMQQQLPTQMMFQMQPTAPSSSDDAYTVDTELINREQTERLVQKALNRNNLNKP